MSKKAMLGYITQHGTSRGFTLGRGRPHDAKVIQKLIDKGLIVPVPRGLRYDFDLPCQAKRIGNASSNYKRTPRGGVLCGDEIVPPALPEKIKRLPESERKQNAMDAAQDKCDDMGICDPLVLAHLTKEFYIESEG